MNIFKTDRFKEGLKAVSSVRITEGLKSLTDPLKNLANNVANNAKTALARRDAQNKSLEIVEIFPRIHWMAFPRPEKIKEISEGLQTKFNGKYFIWNVSEYQYEKEPFNNQVADFTFVGYPCPPFQEIMKICKSILEYLVKDQEGVAIIHCQSTKCRSAVVTSCLLSLLKVVNHPMEALTYFCNRLKLDDTSFLYPSQHQILKNFANVMDKITLNKKSFTLEKVIINEVPKLNDDKDKKVAKPSADGKGEGFRPYIQIFKGSKAIFNHLSKEKPKVYYTSDIAIWFEIGMEIKDEILVRCRHYKSDTERTSVFRVFFNPCFAFDEVVRLNKTEVDFLPDVETTEEFLIDLIIKPTESENNEADTIEKLREECIKLTEEYIKKKQEYDLQQEELRKEQERLEKEAQAKAEKEKQEETAAKENKEVDAKAKFVISESASGDDEDEKEEDDEEILKAAKKNSKDSDASDDKETKEEKAAKNEKIEKLLNSKKEEEEENNEDDELEEEDLDDYISKLEGKTS